MKISIYPNIKTTTGGQIIALSDFLNAIKDGKWKSLIERYRSNPTAEGKKKLPYVTISGTFRERKEAGLVEHSGWLCVDIDKCNVDEVREQIKSDKYVGFMFVSCGGSGLAVGIKINGSEHKKSFLALEKYFAEKYQLKIDPACKDISRPRYISYDPDMIVNEKSKQFTVKDKVQTDQRVIDIIEKMIMDSTEGQRHDNILRASRLAGGYIAGGLLNELEAVDFIEDCCKNMNYDDMTDARRAIRDGVEHGKLYPLKMNDLKEDRTAIVKQLASEVEQEKKEKKNLLKGIECFINNNFDLKRNIITSTVEMRERGQDEYVVASAETIWRRLQSAGYSVAVDKIKTLLKSDFVQDYNPFQVYFDALPEWDGVDYISQLAGYVLTDDQKFFRDQLKKCLVRCLACSLDNIENRIVFTLFSPEQKIGKSHFIRYLSPFPNQEYYTESPLRDNRDSYVQLAENFIYNLEELSTLQRQGIEKLKALISNRTIKERKAYRADAISQPRRCNFFASTNDEEFLTDTSNTRWLIFEIRKFNWAYKKEVPIRNIWSQAYYLYKTGYDYQLTTEEHEQSETNNERYQMTTPEYDLASKYIDVKCKDYDYLTITEIYQFLQDKVGFTIKLYQRNLSAALTRLGAKKGQKKINGKNHKIYKVRYYEDWQITNEVEKKEAAPY